MKIFLNEKLINKMTFSPFGSEIVFKVVTVGETKVGKTSILLRLTEEKFNDKCSPTIGIDFKTKVSIINNVPVRINIWDTAGQEKYRHLTAQYFKRANGILLVYDVNCSDSFSKVPLWLEQIKTYINFKQVSIILLGNKIDINNREVTTQQGLKLANKLDLKFIEVSALSNININTVYDMLIYDMIYKNNVLSIQEKRKNFGRISLDRKSHVRSNIISEYTCC